MWVEMSTGSPSQCQGQQATANALSTAEKSERLTDLTRGVAEQHVVGAVESASWLARVSCPRAVLEVAGRGGASGLAARAFHWRMCPKVNARRNEPNVEGA